MIDVIDNIQRYNAGREPERLGMKYARMRGGAFCFLRATCHLFYDRVAEQAALPEAPAAWCCGDLHLENFGSYKGANRLAYFDINDFDEGALAPLSWDLLRFVASVLVGAKDMGLAKGEAKTLCTLFLDSYADALARGKSGWVERDIAGGLIGDLLGGVMQRTRADFLDRRTELKGNARRIRIDGKKALAAGKDERARAVAIIDALASGLPEPAFFEALDVARRIAGTGSLGVERYIVLVRGKGGPSGNYLLDIKQALPSSLAPHLRLPQSAWASEAQRIVQLQYRMQAVSMAFLHAASKGKRSYVVRALLPSEDRITLDRSVVTFERFREVMQTMACIVASDHLRGAGRDGSAIADDLIAFGRSARWQAPLLAAAKAGAEQVARDWDSYCKAYDAGAFKPG